MRKASDRSLLDEDTFVFKRKLFSVQKVLVRAYHFTELKLSVTPRKTRFQRRLRGWLHGLALACMVAVVALPGAAIAAPDDGSAASSPQPVLIYDVLQERVVGAIPNTAEIRREADGWLKQVKTVSPKMKIGHDSGIVIRIPFEPPLPVAQAGLSFQCKDLFLVIPSLEAKKQNPQLLAFSTEDQTYVYEGKLKALKPFLEKHDLMHWLTVRPKKQPHPAPDTRLSGAVQR